jgi:hypothetical protein
MLVHEYVSTPQVECDRRDVDPAEQRKLLYRDALSEVMIERSFAIRRKCTHDQNAFDSFFESERPRFWFDHHSYHYFLTVHEQPTGTMTATRAIDGEMDCQDFYPPELISNYRHCIFTPCKFVIRPGSHSSFRLMRLMVRETWRDLLTLGCRVSVMNARVGLVPFYRRMGFHVVNHSEFVHPICGTESRVLVMSADPNQRSYFSDLFETIEDPVALADLSRYCDLSDFVSEGLSEKGSDPFRRGQETNEIDSPPKGQTPFRIGSESRVDAEEGRLQHV